MSTNPTTEFYELLNQAYRHFNRWLYDDQLPGCMLTLQRNRNTMGYFSAERWVDGKGYKAHEIALNPAYFARHRVID
ncbi:MAG: sprT domain-containing protein, partial [bacterium]